ncbi:MAG: hypothetical protein JO102_01280, partial [Elusimicrobia bacterium]|nr:hypothetical protein [Elusimicrobiota bacterium]
VKSEEGFFVELAAELLQPADRRTVLWEGRGRPSHPRRPFFVAGAPLGPKEREGIHQAVLDSAAESADNLLNALRKSAE